MRDKTFVALSLFYFLFFALIGDYVIFLPKHFKQMGFSAPQIGLIFAMLPVARFVTPFVYLKKPLTKRDFIFALLLSGVMSLLLLFNSFYLILLSFFLIGVSFSIVFPYIEAIAIERFKEKYGKTRVYGSIGFMLFGVLFSYVEFDFIILYILLVFLINITALYFLQDKTLKNSSSSIDFLKEWKFWLAVVFLQVSFGGFYNFFTIYSIKNGIGREYIGWLWSVGVAAEIFIFLFQHRFISRYKPVTLLKVSVFLTSLRWLMLYLFAKSVFMVGISQLLHAFSFAVFHTAALLYISKRYRNKTLAQQFYSGVAYGFAAFLGSVLSGYMYGDKLYLYESLVALAGFLFML